MSIIKGVGLWPSQYLSNLKAFPLALLQPQCERARALFKLLHISEVSLFWSKQSRPINDKCYWERFNYLSTTELVVEVAQKRKRRLYSDEHTRYQDFSPLTCFIKLLLSNARTNNFFWCAESLPSSATLKTVMCIFARAFFALFCAVWKMA